MRCPGQDLRYWKFDDIFDLDCPHCGGRVEFFKDDVFRICDACGYKIVNPEQQLGCAESCIYSDQCQIERGIKRGDYDG